MNILQEKLDDRHSNRLQAIAYESLMIAALVILPPMIGASAALILSKLANDKIRESSALTRDLHSILRNKI